MCKLSDNDMKIVKEVLYLRGLGVCWRKLEIRFDINRIGLEHLVCIYNAEENKKCQE
jgi:hypothetical protein